MDKVRKPSNSVDFESCLKATTLIIVQVLMCITNGYVTLLTPLHKSVRDGDHELQTRRGLDERSCTHLGATASALMET
jgi:hypothetical protein